MYSLWYASPALTETPSDIDTHNSAVCFWAPTLSDDEAYIAYNIKYTHTFGGAGQVTFTLPTSNIAYDRMSVRYTVIELRLDGDVIWDGQVDSVKRDFFNQKTVTVAGAMAWLSDTEQYIGGRLTYFDETSRSKLDYPSKANMVWYILQYGDWTTYIHNAAGEEVEYTYTVGHNNHSFNYGKFYYNLCSSTYAPQYASFDDSDIGSICTSLEAINKVFRNDAVYMYITYGPSRSEYGQSWCRNVNIWSQALGRNETQGDPDQEIVFAENLLSIDEQINGADVINCIWPLGDYVCELDDPKDFDRINISGIGAYDYGGIKHAGGSPIVYYRPDGYKMSPTYKIVTFDDVTSESDLWTNAVTYLQDNVYKDLTLDISAVDLKDAGVDVDRLQLGFYYRVVSVPHGLDKKMLLSAVSLDLQNPANNTYTFGYSGKTLADDVLRSGQSIETHTRDISAISNRVSSARTAAATADAKAVAAQDTADGAVKVLDSFSVSEVEGTTLFTYKTYDEDGTETEHKVNSPIGSISVEGKTSINQQSVSYRTITINGTDYNILMANDT